MELLQCLSCSGGQRLRYNNCFMKWRWSIHEQLSTIVNLNSKTTFLRCLPHCSCWEQKERRKIWKHGMYMAPSWDIPLSVSCPCMWNENFHSEKPAYYSHFSSLLGVGEERG